MPCAWPTPLCSRERHFDPREQKKTLGLVTLCLVTQCLVTLCPWALWYTAVVVKVVPWEVVLCRYREGGALGTALWRYWGMYFGDTVGLAPWVGKAVPWEVVLCK